MAEPSSLSALRTRFNAELSASGDVTDPAWLAAFYAIPRDPFVPHFFTQTPDTPGWQLVEPSSPQWRESVYSMAPLITQIDGDDSLTETAHTGQAVNGPATSSSSAPTLMGLMLQALDVHDGQTVLEVGTGTGYNTALLCHRLGPDNVTSMDVDAALITRAGERLAALGYTPHLVASDGRDGFPERAPFDRVIATVGLGRVPAAWIGQTRDGGRLLVPLDRRSCGGLLALLTVHGSLASGPFLPSTPYGWTGPPAPIPGPLTGSRPASDAAVQGSLAAPVISQTPDPALKEAVRRRLAGTSGGCTTFRCWLGTLRTGHAGGIRASQWEEAGGCARITSKGDRSLRAPWVIELTSGDPLPECFHAW